VFNIQYFIVEVHKKIVQRAHQFVVDALKLVVLQREAYSVA